MEIPAYAHNFSLLSQEDRLESLAIDFELARRSLASCRSEPGSEIEPRACLISAALAVGALHPKFVEDYDAVLSYLSELAYPGEGVPASVLPFDCEENAADFIAGVYGLLASNDVSAAFFSAYLADLLSFFPEGVRKRMETLPFFRHEAVGGMSFLTKEERLDAREALRHRQPLDLAKTFDEAGRLNRERKPVDGPAYVTVGLLESGWSASYVVRLSEYLDAPCLDIEGALELLDGSGRLIVSKVLKAGGYDPARPLVLAGNLPCPRRPYGASFRLYKALKVTTPPYAPAFLLSEAVYAYEGEKEPWLRLVGRYEGDADLFGVTVYLSFLDAEGRSVYGLAYPLDYLAARRTVDLRIPVASAIPHYEEVEVCLDYEGIAR